ncbi:tRNA guanosine(15) transglycosylase TgtA [Halobacteriales archaeon QH_2_66_30]|nr:MAG: tRNA guanosine(15) transglycosylase TgtA [Halobacteriales archaeon QH_2_66_30]
MSNFEVRSHDGSGRVGELIVPRADLTVETPALLPVVNPHVQGVPPSDLADRFGAQILITNSYILHGSEDLREPALEQGIHDLLEFPGAVMTDSGSFQLAEYGNIEVTTREIIEFQHEIGADIATPVDIPTPPDVPREQAAEEQETTQERLETAAGMDTGEMLVSAPIQGSTYPDLRERAAREAAETGLDVYPVGAVVPLMNEYRYADLVEVVVATKHGLSEDAPVHLFGAGHPMMFALAAALGCDLFDSAAYALYARDDRYLTVHGTEHLEDITHRLLAEHNLSVSFGEMRRVRDAIRRGNLLELVEARARGHPRMLDGYRTLLDHARQLEATDPVSKDAFFYLSADSPRRPEVLRHHERLARIDVGGELLVGGGEVNRTFDEYWRLVPPFGPVPPALSDVYPLTAQMPDRLDNSAYEAAARGVAALVEANPDLSVTVLHDGWPETALSMLPETVAVRTGSDD